MKGFDTESLETDQAFIARVLRSWRDDDDKEKKAWAEFVERYKNEVYKVAESWAGRILFFLKGKKTGGREQDYGGIAQEAFLWIFQHLPDKLANFKAGEWPALSAYLGVVLHYQDRLYKDFLRWRYPSRTYVPKVLQKPSVTKEERLVFVRLREGTLEAEIAEEMNCSIAKVLEFKEAIIQKLFEAESLPKKIPDASRHEKKMYGLMQQEKTNEQIAAQLRQSSQQIAQLKANVLRLILKSGSLPRVLHRCSEETQKAFVLLQLRQPEQQIAEELQLASEDLQEIKNEIGRQLLQTGGREDLLPRPHEIELSGELMEILALPTELDEEMQMLLRKVVARFSKSLAQLSLKERQLLRLFYNKDLSAQQILAAYKCSMLDLPAIEKTIHDSTAMDVHKSLARVRANLLKLFQHMCCDLPGANVTNQTVRTYLEQLGVALS